MKNLGRNHAKIFTPPIPLRDCLLGYVSEAKDPTSLPADGNRIRFDETPGHRARAIVDLSKCTVVITFKEEAVPVAPQPEDVAKFEFRSSKPSVEQERAALLADIEKGRCSRVTVSQFLWVFDLKQGDLDMLRQHGELIVFTDPYRSWTTYIHGQDIIALNDRIEAMRSADEKGGEA